MIDILTNAFLTNPVPIQFTGNYCSHGCSYCFANVNNPQRKLDIKKTVSILNNFHKRDDLVSYYMREKYPILISNNIDPFSKSNQPFVNELIGILADLEIPVVLATRGGVGWQEIADSINKSVWYISIPYNSDDKRKELEPNAPTIESRWGMAKYLKEKEHEVIIAINPFNPNFAPNPLEIAQKAKEIGIYSLLINKIHLSPKQQANLTNKQKEQIGEDLLLESRKKGYTDLWLDNAMILEEFCINNGMQLMGLDYGLSNNSFVEWELCYKKTLPTQDDFFNWVAKNKKENDLIYFQEFYNFFEPHLPKIETNISKFIFNKAVIETKNSYKKQPLKNLLHYYWQTKGIELGLAKNYPVYSWAMKNYKTKQDFIFDSEHNKVLVYTPTNFNTKDYLVINA